MAQQETTGRLREGDGGSAVLVGDIGGTHARFELLGCSEATWQVQARTRFPSDSCASLHAAMERALAVLARESREEVHSAWLAVAGPVSAGRGRLTNLGWEVDAESLARACDLPAVHVVNDLEALAFGVATLDESGLLILQQGRVDPTAMGVVIAVGTGLGVAAWRRRDGVVEVFASEGGHADLAPGNVRESRILADLGSRHGHVSWERALSGGGLVELYRLHCQGDPAAPARGQWLHEAAAVADLACEDGDHHATAAARMFIDLLAGFAGNTALQWLARGGVYLSGGVVDGLLPLLNRKPGFVERFQDKGRMSPLLAELRISVPLVPDLGLRGIGLMAQQRTGYS